MSSSFQIDAPNRAVRSSIPPGTRVVIMQSRMGPYHWSRLRACHDFFRNSVTGLEIASQDEYEWGGLDHSGLPLITLFPNTDYRELRPDLIRNTVFEALTRIMPDAVVINGWSFPEARSAVKWCRSHNRVAIVASDSKVDDAPRSAVKEYIKRRMLRYFDAALAAGTRSSDYLKQLGFSADRIFFGADTVDNTFFAEQAEKFRGNIDDTARWGVRNVPFFMANNRFIPLKNLPALLEAYAAYRETTGINAWDLVLVGDGPQRGELEQLVVNKKIEGVFFPGFRQIQDLPFYYGRAACFIHPSYKDTWGLVINEAMACSLPVLVSRNAGAAADLVLEGKNGWTFDPYSITDMTSLMIMMHELPENERRSMGLYSLKIISQWDLDRFVEGVELCAIAGIRHLAGRRGRLSLLDKALLRF